jgi:hypothetical protein
MFSCTRSRDASFVKLFEELVSGEEVIAGEGEMEYLV